MMAGGIGAILLAPDTRVKPFFNLFGKCKQAPVYTSGLQMLGTGSLFPHQKGNDVGVDHPKRDCSHGSPGADKRVGHPTRTSQSQATARFDPTWLERFSASGARSTSHKPVA